MNFFGHLVIARDHDGRPPWLLGAMLPDLTVMAGIPGLRGVPGVLGAGVGFHHVTDEVFHGAPAFRELMTRLGRRLAQTGLRRGSARAASHVAIELHLDGVLAADDDARAAFERAMAFATNSALAPALGWTTEDADRWSRLCARLQDGALVRGYRDAGFVAECVLRILKRRPRLAPDEAHAQRLQDVVAAAAPEARARANELIAAVATSAQLVEARPDPRLPVAEDPRAVS